MKRLIGAAAVVFGFVLVLSTFSYAAEIKIGYVDFQKVQSESKAGKDVYANIEKTFKEKQTQLDQRQNELEKMMQELDKQ